MYLRGNAEGKPLLVQNVGNVFHFCERQGHPLAREPEAKRERAGVRAIFRTSHPHPFPLPPAGEGICSSHPEVEQITAVLH